jgi:hypothetical protein
MVIKRKATHHQKPGRTKENARRPFKPALSAPSLPEIHVIETPKLRSIIRNNSTSSKGAFSSRSVIRQVLSRTSATTHQERRRIRRSLRQRFQNSVSRALADSRRNIKLKVTTLRAARNRLRIRFGDRSTIKQGLRTREIIIIRTDIASRTTASQELKLLIRTIKLRIIII